MGCWLPILQPQHHKGFYMILKTTVPLWLTVGITCSPSVPLCNAQYIFKMLAMVNQVFMTQVQHSLCKLLPILQSAAYEYMCVCVCVCVCVLVIENWFFSLTTYYNHQKLPNHNQYPQQLHSNDSGLGWSRSTGVLKGSQVILTYSQH